MFQTKPALALRSAIFYVGYFFGTIFISSFFILGFPLLGIKGRHLFASVWCGFALNWLKLSCGAHYQIIGLENLSHRPAVILANHESSWETILFYMLVFPVSPILKKELMRIPFWGWAMRLQQPIAIDRSNPREAGKSLLVQGVDRISSGNSVIVFPEGTRSRTGKIKRFSRGGAKLAVAAGVPIIPIAHNAGRCWPPEKIIKHPGLVTVVIGEPVSITDGDASQLTDDVEAWIRKTVAEMD